MSEVAEKKKRNPGCIIAIVMIVLGAFAAYGGNAILKPVAPAVILPAEPIWPGIWMTNTMLATIIADILLILGVQHLPVLKKGQPGSNRRLQCF